MTLSGTTTRHDHGQTAGSSTSAAPGSLDQLPGKVSEAAGRLHRRLHCIYAAESLDRPELSSTQRGIARLHRSGVAPGPNEFWETTAQPRAQQLARRAKIAVDGELARLVSGWVPDLWLSDQPQRVAVSAPEAQADPLVAELLAAIPTRGAIDDLGRWWQRRLRRSAIVRALPVVATKTPKALGLVVSQLEMQLLDQAPWSHGDRLLSAFELAHSEIRTYGHNRISEIINHLLGSRWFRPC